MYKHAAALLAVTLLLGMPGYAKDKDKDKGRNLLPPYLLRARTVAVIVDPGAGMSIDDPQANRVAQKDVETALANWGRFEPVLSTRSADLIIVLRKGTGRVVNQTVNDPRQNRRPGSIDSSDSGAGIGAQRGQQPSLSGDPGLGSGQTGPRPQTEIGESDDSFAVYEGDVENPLDNSPGWRYVARDGLRPHTVPAVAEFRKVLAEAEKAAAKKP